MIFRKNYSSPLIIIPHRINHIPTRSSHSSVLQPVVPEAGKHFVNEVFPVPASLADRGAARLHPSGALPSQLHNQSLQSVLPAEIARCVYGGVIR